MNVQQSAFDAAQRINNYVLETPVEHSLWLSEETGADVWFKCENLQHTGSFKYRGAVNKLLSLSDAERSAGVVAASTGNHGAAVAIAGFLKQKDRWPGKQVAIVLCGANISKETMEELL